MRDSNPVNTFTYVIHKLNDYGLAYLHLVEPTLPVDHLPQYLKEVAAYFRRIYHGTLISCGGYDFEKAKAAMDAGIADLIAFGTWYISNPDLVERFENNAPLNEPDLSTYYVGGMKGYNDYPLMEKSI
jgi:N-ethylmaleimide reductase